MSNNLQSISYNGAMDDAKRVCIHVCIASNLGSWSGQLITKLRYDRSTLIDCTFFFVKIIMF